MRSYFQPRSLDLGNSNKKMTRLYWRNATVYRPPEPGYYTVEIGEPFHAETKRLYWCGRAWRHNHHSNEQFNRVHNVLRFCFEIEK